MRKKASKTPPKDPNFQFHVLDTSQFDTPDGLMRQAGVGWDELRRLIVKEVVDNALDEMDSLDEEARLSGLVTVSKDGDDAYIVEDDGRGITQDRDKLCNLFFAHRPMATGKFLRRPSRGTLGNGLRVLAAAVALSEKTIVVESHGQRTTLRPQTEGFPTEVVAQTASRRKQGTRITFSLDDKIIPRADNDLMHAEAAIKLAYAAGPPYKRRSLPHWLDLDHLIQAFRSIRPDATGREVTVRQFVEGLDGCSGDKAGHIAAPFGKTRTCSDMRKPEIADLLTRMQENTNEVNPKKLGPIGPDAFDEEDEEYDGYKAVEAWLIVGTHQPRARIPVLIETWADVFTRQRGEAKLAVYCNRTPMVGRVDATRSREGIHLSGAGLVQYGHVMKVPGGDCDLILAITSPHIPIVSNGKAPHLLPFQRIIVEALEGAFKQSRRRLGPDPDRPKPPKGEPKPKKAKPEPYQVSGPLATFLAEEAEKAGVSPDDLLVTSNDPFDENRAIRRNAEWFVEQVKLVPKSIRTIHSRAVYYVCVSDGNVYKPNGEKFKGSHTNSQFVETAAKYARYLGLVSFDLIVDERAAPPELYVYDENHIDAGSDPIHRELLVSDGRKPVSCDQCGALQPPEPLAVPELDLLLPALSISAPQTPRQPYRIVFIGEKSSLKAVLDPLAREVRGELILGTGEISEPMVYGICKRAAADGRPLVILYFSDFDPAGWRMNYTVARKIQAQIRREFPDLKVRLIRVALTFEQVKKYNLPDAPIKIGEKQGKPWLKRWWPERVKAAEAKGETPEGGQVEIDALAALRPEVLEDIARKAVAPYFDFTYERRYREAMKMPPDRLTWFLDQPAYRKVKPLVSKAHKLAAQAMAALNAAQAAAIDAMRDVVENEAPGLPDVIVEPDIPENEPEEAVFNSDDEFLPATRKLQRIKAWEVEDQAEEEDEDQDEDEGEDQDEEDADEDTEEEEDESM